MRAEIDSLARYITRMRKEGRDIYRYMTFPYDGVKSRELEMTEDSSEYVDDCFSGVSYKELAKRIGISLDTLKKRLSRNRPINRDFVIAVCSQLQLGFRNTNYALMISGFPLLYKGDNYQKNNRDERLINILQKGTKKRLSLDDINKMLKTYNEFPLDVKGRKNIENNLEYVVLNTNVEITNYDVSVYNPYDSLETLYDIDLYNIKASAVIKSRKSEDELTLELYDNSIGIFDKHKILSKFYQNYQDDELAKYSILFEDLNKMIASKRKDVFKQLDDTKNYGERYSAKYINGIMHIFGECYNFDIPEKNEYFFVDYYNNEFHFYISNRSRFLYYQMGEDRYKEFILNFNPIIICKFNSIVEIEKFYKNKSKTGFDFIYKQNSQRFKGLVSGIQELLIKLKQKDIFIRNPDIYEGPDMVYNMCCYLGVEKQFDFVFDLNDTNPFEEEYKNLNKSLEVEFQGKSYDIDLHDIYQAFIYGLKDINEICEVKSKYKSLEEWICAL